MWLVTILLSVNLSVWVAAGDSSCAPPSCNDTEPGTFIRDPNDCRRYYICLQGGRVSDFTGECDAGQLFGGAGCEDEAGVNCEVCVPPCTFSCPKGAGESSLVAVRSDCSKYVICIPGMEPIEATCTDDKPFFNGEVCSTNGDECCDSCSTFCSERLVEIPDPTNCSNFYFCDREGYPDESDLFPCSVGNFDESVGYCTENATCRDPCASTPPTPPSTPRPPPTPTPTTTPPPDGAVCRETFKCESVGFFPKCLNRCDPYFYECRYNDIGKYVNAMSCTGNKLLDPDRMMCVMPWECPYPPHLY